MIIPLIYILMISTPFEFENYLGKNIDSIELNKHIFQVKDETFYSISDPELSFFGNNLRSVSFQTNDFGIINKINLHFASASVSILEGMINKYGEPTHKLKEDLLLKSEYLPTNPNNYSKEYSTREIEDGEKPTIVIWEVEDFQLKVFFNSVQNTTKINFTSKIY